MDKDYEHLLNELLAIIHHDGGHYVQEHGIEKAVKDAIKIINKERSELSNTPYEPYFGWCDVKDCEKEGCSGGMAWRETGYWTVCSEHHDDSRAGKPQPRMKQKALERERSRGEDGVLPPSTKQMDRHRNKWLLGKRCGNFYPDTTTSSATKCKCGYERWEHPIRVDNITGKEPGEG